LRGERRRGVAALDRDPQGGFSRPRTKLRAPMMSWAYLLLCATWRPTSWIILPGVADAAGRVHGPSSDGRPDGRPIDPALQVAALRNEAFRTACRKPLESL